MSPDWRGPPPLMCKPDIRTPIFLAKTPDTQFDSALGASAASRALTDEWPQQTFTRQNRTANQLGEG